MERRIHTAPAPTMATTPTALGWLSNEATHSPAMTITTKNAAVTKVP